MRTLCSAARHGLLLHGLILGALVASACSGELAIGASGVEYTLRVTPPLGGTIASADGSIRCPGQCEISRPVGTRLQLTASADERAQFDLWTEGCTGLLDPSCEVGFVGPITAAARFISCNDKIQNGAETDIDCGGPVCGPCNPGSACQIDGDCAQGLSCASNVCSVLCSASSVKVLGNRAPTITPESVASGSTANVLCRYPTYQFLLGTTVVQDFTTNNASKVNQAISCHRDGAWYAPNGEKFDTLNCVGFAPCNGCALPGTGSGTTEAQ